MVRPDDKLQLVTIEVLISATTRVAANQSLRPVYELLKVLDDVEATKTTNSVAISGAAAANRFDSVELDESEDYL
jgi:hypothetical protein